MGGISHELTCISIGSISVSLCTRCIFTRDMALYLYQALVEQWTVCLAINSSSLGLVHWQAAETSTDPSTVSFGSHPLQVRLTL